MKHLEVVLTILVDQSLYENFSKCEFGMTEMLYVGDVTGKEGVKFHMENIQAITNWKIPKNVT